MICSKCGVDKQSTDFPKNGRDKTGATRYRPECKECYNALRKANRKKFVKFKASTKHRTGEVNTITFEDWKEAMLHFKGMCCYCGNTQSRRNRLTKEHLVPVSAGGQTVRNNIAPACRKCNSSKQDIDMDKWYRSQPFFDEERYTRIKEWMLSGK